MLPQISNCPWQARQELTLAMFLGSGYRTWARIIPAHLPSAWITQIKVLHLLFEINNLIQLILLSSSPTESFLGNTKDMMKKNLREIFVTCCLSLKAKETLKSPFKCVCQLALGIHYKQLCEPRNESSENSMSISVNTSQETKVLLQSTIVVNIYLEIVRIKTFLLQCVLNFLL